MENTSNYENRSLEWWRGLASRLAFLFAATILIASGIGLWFSGEMRDLRQLNTTLSEEFAGVVKTNETLAMENAETNEIAKTRLETIEKLNTKNHELTIKHNKLLKELEIKNSRN